MANILDEGSDPILDEGAGSITDELGPETYGTARQGVMTIPRAVAGTWP